MLTNVCRNNGHVALKILTADSYGGPKETFELDILYHLKTTDPSNPGAQHILGLLDTFHHSGPYGDHVCLVFKAMGPDLVKYRQLFPRSRIPVHLIKQITRQLLLALAYLHESCGITHTDIKPQNILVETPAIDDMLAHAPSGVFRQRSPPSEPPNDFYMKSEQVSSVHEDLATLDRISVRLGDFGSANWFDRHLTEWIQPQMLRAPELILGCQWDSSVDIWNLGVVVSPGVFLERLGIEIPPIFMLFLTSWRPYLDLGAHRREVVVRWLRDTNSIVLTGNPSSAAGSVVGPPAEGIVEQD
ncbi:MAG: hypothetical protein M1819_002846 [Sarea resinae]|nr:MAG: hypothetical protein M1819_002846 [Sarea resinae]